MKYDFIIKNQELYGSLLDRAIERYGYAPEHNTEWFGFYTDLDQMPVFVSWPDGTGLMTHKGENSWYTFSEPLAPAGSRGEKLAEFTCFALTQLNIKKVVIEARTETKEETLKYLSPDFEILPDYTLVWPMMNLSKFDPELPGGHFKTLRNAKNIFFRDHKVEVVDAADVTPTELHEIVKHWRLVLESKHVQDIHDNSYHNIIDGNFRGTKTARAMVVDSKIVGFNAGWEIPNMNIFYAAIGIHNYSIRDLGLLLFLEDLEWLKRAGYLTVDLGGVENGGPLRFKNQFFPNSYYNSFVFSVFKK